MRTGEVGAMVGRAPREGANRSFRRSSRAANRANRVHRNKDPKCPTRGDDASRTFPCLFVAGLFGASGEAELAPTDDAVLDQPVAGFRDFLLLPTLAWVNSRGFSTATEGAKRLASSTILSCFSMAWRSARSSTQRRATTRLAPCLCGLARFRAIANQVALELATRAGTTAT